MLFSFPIPYLRKIVYETEIITRNQSSDTLPFLVTKSKMILSEKEMLCRLLFLQPGKGFLLIYSPTGYSQHSALDRLMGAVAVSKGRGLEMESKALPSPLLSWALMCSASAQAGVLRAERLDG